MIKHLAKTIQVISFVLTLKSLFQSWLFFSNIRVSKKSTIMIIDITLF